MSKPKLIIIGGGAAGLTLARDKQLTAAADVTLIDAKPFLEFTPYALRAAVQPEWGAKHVVYNYCVPGATLKVGSVAEVDAVANVVRMEDGATLPFDHLVVASGSSSHSAVSKTSPQCPSVAARVDEYKAAYEELSQVQHVLVVGGGTTAVEWAAEVKSAFPDKQVTMVHSGPALLHFLKKTSSNKAHKFMDKHGVKVILNDKVHAEDGSSGPWATEKGVPIPSGKAYLMTGVKPNTKFMPSSAVDDKGQIKVDDSLALSPQIGSKNPIYAVGDCSNSKDAKMWYAAGAQANWLKVSLLNDISQKKGKKRLYKPAAPGPNPPVQVITLGPADGIMQTPLGVFGGWLPRKMKSAGTPGSMMMSIAESFRGG